MAHVMGLVERVQTRAATVSPLQALRLVVVAPFYLLGLVVGFVVAVVMLLWASLAVGVGDARRALGERDA